MNKKLLTLIGASLSTTPLAALAAPFVPDPAPVRIATFDLNAFIGNILGFIWPVIVFAVIILFMVIGFEFINAGGDAPKVTAARQHLIWALVGVMVILLSFSIVMVVRTALPGV